MSKIKNQKVKFAIAFVMLSIGTLLAAIALDNFLLPNMVFDGGVNGIGIIISELLDIPLSILVIVLNIPFMFIGYKHLGRAFLFRTIYTVLAFAALLEVFEGFGAFTNELLVATVFGSLLLGIGVGLIVRFGGCIDGFELLALAMSKKTSFSVGQVVMAINLIIYVIAGFMFGFDRALYSLLVGVISYKVIDAVSAGLEQEKAALIITAKGTKLSKVIYEKLGRTTTTIKGKGLVSGEKEVLYCVLTRMEMFELRHLVAKVDESAFVTVLEVSEIIGEHIKPTSKIKKIIGLNRD